MHMRLRLADITEVEFDNAPPLPLTARDAALLAWLALEGPTPRDRLCSLLWPASTDMQARTTLRQRLFQLKKVLGCEIASGSPLLALAAHVPHDLDDAFELLGDLSLPDAPELDQWLSRQREQRRQREIGSLVEQAQALEDAGDLSAAVSVAHSLLRLEPLSEIAHRRLVRLLYLAGDRAAALAAFDRCEQLLKHELGARPSAETLALLSTIERALPVSAPAARRSWPAALQRPPRIVGRERELAALAAAWDNGRVPAVTGEAGMGKSRLLSDFIEARQGTERAAGRPGDGDVPFATLARLLRSVAAARPPVLDPAMRRELARVLPELGTAGAALPEGRRLPLQNALAAFLKAAPELQGLVLDDLHFADTATLEVLPSLITETHPVRWALAYRPAEAGTPVKVLENALTDGMSLVPIAVAPLDEPALAQLVDQLDLDVAGVAVAGELRRRTGGNPLFVLEILKQAWVNDGIGRLGEGGMLPLPVTVGQLIDRRIGLLSAQALALARVASIAGIDFSIGLAESVLGIQAILLTDAVNELESAQVLKGVQFAHDLVFDAVRRALPPAIASHTHARVAQWLETMGGEPARIALHWIEGGSPVDALRWLGLAAENARQALRNHEALGFLEQRAGIEAELGLRAQAFATQLELVKSSILLEPARERTEGRIDTLARYADSEAQHCRVSMERVHAAGTHNDDLRVAALAEETLLRATRCGETEIVMQCHLALASASTRARQLPAALAHAQACRAWIEQFGGQERQMELHAYLGSIYGQLGPLADAVFHHERAIELGRSLGRMHDCATALFNLAQTLSGCGQSIRALPLAEEVSRIERAHESPPTYAAATQALLSVTHTRLGHYASALSAAAVGRQLLETPGVVPRLKESLAQFEAQCWLHLGQRARALTLINAGLAVASVPYFRAHWLRLRFTAAEMHGSAGPNDLEEALTLFSDASTSVHMDLQLLRSLLLPAGQALDLLDRVRATAQRSDHGAQRLLSHLNASRLLLTDDPGRAAEHAARAWQLASQHDLGFSYRGELYLHCARAFMACGDERRGHQVIAAGQTWLADTVQHELPPDCRESFLHRNPCNAALAVLAASVGART